MTILLVEDNDTDAKLHGIHIEGMGGIILHRMSLVGEVMRTDLLPDLAVVDLGLPNGQGIEGTLKPIRAKLGVNVPLIILTGDDRPKTIEAAIELGVIDYVVKTQPRVEARIIEAVRKGIQYISTLRVLNDVEASLLRVR